MFNYHGFKVIMPEDEIPKEQLEKLESQEKLHTVLKCEEFHVGLVRRVIPGKKPEDRSKVVWDIKDLVGTAPNRYQKRNAKKLENRKNNKGFPHGFSELEYMRYVKENGIKSSKKERVKE